MKRISIIGCPGAGKSSFAKKLQAITNIPLIHLDKEYWLPNWQQPDKGDWNKHVEKLVAQDCWITDGNYGSTFQLRFPRADTIIYLETNRWQCLFRALKRSFQSYGQTREDMGAGCKERLDLHFIKYILWDFPNRGLPKLKAALEEHKAGKTLYISRSFKQSDEILAKISAEFDLTA